MIHKKFRFDHTNKWYILENETYKILQDFETQKDYLILARRPDLMIVIKKRTCRNMDFAVTAEHRMKLKESRELKKLWNFDGDTDCNWRAR